ncbi:hypothetical protein F4556_006005 [Kitasatospora gansuensis]|uniref:Uncharacterized protein n=2 Tax=Kitasatospora TaxID=2063 RepID=A0A7W7SHC4_9ACTN|nr:hypothetical protein [Kitasatospora gansuensis]MBB4950470.1 hypothetical protein [Kitasatospora gansuensis]
MPTEPFESGETAREDSAISEARRVLRAAVSELRQEALFNFGEMTAVKLTAVLGQLLEHSELPHRYLKTVRAVFAEPDGYPETYAALEEPGAVLVLLRKPGAGRAFTAHALLADLHLRTGATVGPLSFGGTARFPLRRLPHEENAGYLLELPADEENFTVSDDFGAMLHEIHHILEKRNSRLIVLAAPKQWQRVSAQAPPNIVPVLGRPDPLKIAGAWLRAEAPDLDSRRWLDDERISGLLARQRPSDVLQIVALILKADEAKHPALRSDADPDGFNAKVLDVLKARTAWREDLLEWHRKPGRTSFERNFLLVAALFRNASVGHVYAQTAELCSRFKTPVSLRGQEAPGVVELVDEIGAELDLGADTLDFGRPGWDDAVLGYFWVDRPTARMTFLSWMADAPRTRAKGLLESFTRDERLLLANRVGAFAVRWATRHRKSDPLDQIITAWSKDPDLWRAATDLISAAALHPTFGRLIHEFLLRWSKSKDNPALCRLAVDVCAGEFGRRHTGKALIRLGHAAESETPAVQESLRAAVRTIWSDPTARESLFTSIIQWCAPESPRLRSGCRAFAALATLTSSRSGTANNSVLLVPGDGENGEFVPKPGDLSAGWSALLSSEEEKAGTADAFNLWMDTAHQRPDLQPLIFGVLRGALSAAAPGQARRLRHQLRDVLYEWQPVPATDADPARVQLRHELADLLDHDRSRAVAPYRPRTTSAALEDA